MNLGHGGGGQRLRVNGGKKPGQAARKLVFQGLLDLGKGDLPAVILKLFELFRPVRRDEVGPG